ncbi:lipocalin-like domain-containing protein [Sporosarcina sp. ACRSL]|uniref:lipocalin-like domain-containing protein n=1 Tax=Sporosarcina sp. ACRSL TaxID=2918215 RepID=UPI001EF4495C|nr:lipocalin-like domain-containing protein [Sporosarcina sp. ACRSL]MCG7343086.1 lipocalin-like domain-containing protein [Sporosarcina sp. ACRSL]
MTTLKEQIVGVWSLVSFQDQDQNGNTFNKLGENATGFIMYHPEGYMSAQLMQQGRAPYQSRDMLKGTTKEMAEAALGYLAYAGKFDVNEEERTLIHHMEVSMNPTWLGQLQPRLASIEGDLLTIHNGLNPNQKLIWKRVKAYEF